MSNILARMKDVRHEQDTNSTPVPVVPSSRAMFCVDCEMIFIAGRGNNNCPKCASGATAPMSNWINV